MSKVEHQASKEDIEILKSAIANAHSNGTFYKGWFSQDLDKLISDDNIYRFYEVDEKGFAGAIGYVLTKDNKVLMLKHDINDVNTAYCITHYFVEHEIIRNNFYLLYDEDLKSE